MGAIRTLAIMPLALLALACGRDAKPRGNSAALSEDLRGDLERASAPTSDLAATRFRPTQVVSSIELGTAPAAPKGAQPQKRKTHHVKPSPAPRVAQVKAVAVEPAPAPAPEPTVVATAPAPQPTAGPRPKPNPVDYPSGQGSSTEGDHGVGIGTVIGVIIRGGSIGDDDHCELHRPGRGNAGVMINQRFPSPIVGRTTFPLRGGW
jgi:hypothetical protein